MLHHSSALLSVVAAGRFGGLVAAAFVREIQPANTGPNDCVRAAGRNPLVDKKSGRTKREINLLPTLHPVKDGKQNYLGANDGVGSTKVQ